MQHRFSRTELIIGSKNLEILNNKHIAIFGIGGVGSFVVEALARAGIENFTLIDYDDICITNINRQIHATTKTIGKLKVNIMKERILDINPKANVKALKILYNKETEDEIFKEKFDYVVDAIDMVTSKLLLVEKCKKENIPIISSMGTGNKINPTMFEVTDIYKTSVCPLAKVMRRELKKRGIKKLKVIYSKEIPIKPQISVTSCKENCVCLTNTEINCKNKRQIPGSISFSPSVAGLIIASEVVKDILNLKN
ncbi:tRNA A37 threonylcarbamoyladenosine dehydratase [Hypnocyclicus thermotrophus]|uniref:tRNA A37 threonylcarbamoyladenosine dehydratase n=1 Tax=Hypnocyclicus thermotrophus TaxID=1627895 RepID=A0AA46DX52_9FUSO|nr:tRNA threonylcarbamoyladenosine dehydratase [Hypnocyclicus thermotrophus]TDT67437.1 tRNA A37 threonylcarbamoyladenosine dehydratase [Hypnocyclicus thermotrophus]